LRNYVENYSYDAVGNILNVGHQAMNGSWTRTYIYDEPNTIPSNNRLTSTMVGALKEQYEYDPHGNMLQMIHLPQMAWNFKDQLASTQRQAVNSGPGETTFYVYDGSGQRVRKVIQSAGGSRRKERIYLGSYEIYRDYANDGSRVTLEQQTLDVMDGKRRVALVETITTRDAVAMFRYQFDNHLGSVSLELDSNSAVISYEEYYPYGSTSFQTVASAIQVSLKRYRYAGKERDEENGLHYYGARYYASWLGVWTACDPKISNDGSTRYSYARNNPVVMTDPNGADPKTPQQYQTEIESLEAQQRLLSRAVEETQKDLNASFVTAKSIEQSEKMGWWEKLWALRSATKQVDQLTGKIRGLNSQIQQIDESIRTLQTESALQELEHEIPQRVEPGPEEIARENEAATRELDEFLESTGETPKGGANFSGGSRGFGSVGSMVFALVAVGAAVYVIGRSKNKLEAAAQIAGAFAVQGLVAKAAGGGVVGIIASVTLGMRSDDARVSEQLERDEAVTEFLRTRVPGSVRDDGSIDPQAYKQAYDLFFNTKPIVLDQLPARAVNPTNTPAPVAGVRRTDYGPPPQVNHRRTATK